MGREPSFKPRLLRFPDMQFSGSSFLWRRKEGRWRENFRASRLLAPWSGISSNALVHSSSHGTAWFPQLQFLKSKAARRAPEPKQCKKLSKDGITPFYFASTYERQTKPKKYRGSTSTLPYLQIFLFFSFFFFLVFACVWARKRKILHSEL